MALPLFQDRLSALQLNPDSANKFNKLMISGKFVEELYKAYEYVDSLVPAMVPAGITVHTMELVAVKKLLDDQPEGVLFSGTLSQLVLPARLRWFEEVQIVCVINLADTDEHLQNLLGIILVHIEDEEGEQLRFMPVDKQVEVAALCLLMFWHSGDPMRHSRLWTLASDLVFLGRRFQLNLS